jgi:hypothetical protein
VSELIINNIFIYSIFLRHIFLTHFYVSQSADTDTLWPLCTVILQLYFHNFDCNVIKRLARVPYYTNYFYKCIVVNCINSCDYLLKSVC